MNGERLVEYILKIIYALGLVGVTFASAWLWGRVCFSRLLGKDWTAEERNILTIGLGLGLISYLFFFLSLLGLLYSWLIFLFLGLPVLRFLFPRSARAGRPGVSLRPLRSGAAYGLLAVFLLVFLLNLGSSAVPPYAGDAIGYHLPAARAYLENHGLVRLEGNVLANQPAALDMLYLIGFAGGSELFPRLLHCLIGFLLALSIYAGGRRFFGTLPALLAMTIFYTVPSVSKVSSWAYIDLGLAFWVFWSALALLRWRGEGGERFLVLAAVLAGLAMGSKYTGLTFFALLWLLAGAESLISPGKQGRRRPLLLGGLLALAVASPWYLKNLLVTGNPCYPFLFSVFGGPDWDAVRAADYRSVLLGYGMGKGIEDFLLLPWNLTIKAGYSYRFFDGRIGPAFLVFLPLALFSGKKKDAFRFLGVYSLLYFAVWALLSQQVRILIPVLPFVSLLIGATIGSLWGKGGAVLKAVLVLVLGVVLAVNLEAIVGEVRSLAPLRVIAGKETESDFLSRMVYNYPAVDYINKNLPPDSRVLFVYGGNGWYYCERATVVDSIFQDHTLKRLLRESGSLRELAAGFRGEGISHILINRRLAAEGLRPSLGPEKSRSWDRFLRTRTRVVYGRDPNYLLEII